MHKGILITDKNDRIKFVSRGFAHILDCKPDQLMNRNILNDFNSELFERITNTYIQSKNYLSSSTMQINGSLRFHGEFHPIATNKSFQGMICILCETNYSSSDFHHLKKISDHLPAAIFSRTPDERIKYISPNIEKIIGYQPNITTIKWTDLMSSSHINNDAITHETKANNLPYELELIHKDQSFVRVGIEEFPVINNGKTDCIIGTITKRFKHQNSITHLLRSNYGLQALLRNAPMAIAIGHNNNSIEFVNEKFTELFGYKIDEVKNGKMWEIAFPDEKYRKTVYNDWNKRTNPDNNKHEIAVENVVTCKDGTKKNIQVSWNIINQTLVAFFNDVTQYRKLEKELKTSNEELEKAKRKAENSDMLKSAFLANMSHEIRTPMNSIIGFSNILAEESLSEKSRKKYSGYVKNSGEHLLRIVDDIIDIAKIESNQLRLHFKWIHVIKMLEDIYEYQCQNPLLQRKPKILLKLNIKEIPKKLEINSDPIRLKQVFDNLISNAIKNTHEGSIELGLKEFSKKNNFVSFYVKDTGIGIPEDAQKDIFKRFLQIESQIPQKGSGLGLSIVKGILSLVQGEIWFESKERVGTSFYFKIPINPTF